MRECLPDANAQVDPEERCSAAEVEAHAFLKVNDLLVDVGVSVGVGVGVDVGVGVRVWMWV